MKDERLQNCLSFYGAADVSYGPIVRCHGRKVLTGYDGAAGLPEGTPWRYLVFPSIGNPRWIFPDSACLILHAGHLVKPTRFLSRLAWELFKVGAKLRLPLHWLFPVIACPSVGGRQGALANFFSCSFGGGEVLDFILYTGAKGLYQKYTAQVMTAFGEVVCFAKMAATEDGRNQLARERENLQRLGLFRFQHILVPALLPVTPFGSFAVLALSSPPQGYRPHLGNLTPLHARAIGELFSKVDGGVQSLDDIVKVRANKLSQILHPPETFADLPALISAAVDKLHAACPIEQFPLGYSHGDFTPWNTLVKGAQFFLYDWELADFRPPYWDIFNYIIHYELLVENRSPEEIYKRIDSFHAVSLAAFKEESALPDSISSNFCLIIYLIDIVLYYHDYGMRHSLSRNVISSESRRLLAAAGRMLELMIRRL